ncbi:hypothetical protein ASD39_07855 [Sphingomonas sp. Root50]|nr:hypothetical protein ASD17_05270 [Sphingomonas sp. Root1294]KQY67821.1 hypothetical protein ASD39_07855 [Sphingomonas sp. Root50]
MFASQFEREFYARLHRFLLEGPDGRSASRHGDMAVASTQGPSRERNEDRAVVCELITKVGRRIRLAIVCDGMGGMVNGHDASSRAAAAFLTTMIANTSDREFSPLDLMRACEAANAAVYERYDGKGGTTLTALSITSDSGACVHVGDSRLYAVEHDGDLRLLTRDDTLSAIVQAEAGDVNEDELDNRLLQFVGIGPVMTPALFPVNFAGTNLFFLTSDGTHGFGRKALEGMAAHVRSPIDLARKAVFVANALNGPDNASIACLTANTDEPEMEVGVSIARIWTPSDHIEVWLPDLRRGDHREQAGRSKAVPSDASKAASKPAQERKATRKRPDRPAKLKASSGGNPQDQEVLFRLGEAEADD